MILGILGLVIPLLAMLVFTAWGMFIGLKRTRIRFVCVIVSFLTALILSFTVKNLHTSALMGVLGPMMESSEMEFLTFVWNSESLHEVVSVCGGSILAPWVFLATFVLLCTVSALVCGIAFLISAACNKGYEGEGDLEDEDAYDYDDDEDSFGVQMRRSPLPRVAIYAVVQVLLTTFVILTPVVSLLNVLPGLVKEAEDAGLVLRVTQDSPTTGENQILAAADTLNKTPLVVGYRALGGNAICRGYATFTVEGEQSDLSTELTAITEFCLDIYRLYRLEIQDYTETEIVLLREIDEDMHESVFLPVVSGELIYYITDAWLDEAGPRPALGMIKPTFNKDTNRMAAEPFEHILEAFHKDAYDIDALRDDFHTMECVVEILVTNGITDSMNKENTNLLVELLSDGDTVEQVMTEFDKNPSFAPLRGDLVKIGMRSLGSSLKVSTAEGEHFVQYTGDMADKLNQLNADTNLSEEERKEALTTTIRESYEQKAGKKLGVSDEMVALYTDVLFDEFGDRDDVTAEEMERFFETYAGLESSPTNVTSAANESENAA